MGNILQFRKPVELDPVQQIEQRLERIESLLQELKQLEARAKEKSI